MYWNATVQFLVQFLYQKNILLMKYVQSNAADFEIPKLKSGLFTAMYGFF